MKASGSSRTPRSVASSGAAAAPSRGSHLLQQANRQTAGQTIKQTTFTTQIVAKYSVCFFQNKIPPNPNDFKGDPK
eukprot:6411456-Amphidinium_carterae.1